MTPCPLVDDTLQAAMEMAAREDQGEDVSFEVIHVGAQSPTRPLVVWVHPGDACECDSPSGRVRKNSLSLQSGMGREVDGMLDTHDVVVLHRLSSEFAFETDGRVAVAYQQALENAHDRPSTTVLYGDDLDAAARWLLENAQAACRPSVFMTGAWSHPEHGCVAAVGKDLLAAGATVEVSPSSPSEPGSVARAWSPQRPQTPRRRRAP